MASTKAQHSRNLRKQKRKGYDSHIVEQCVIDRDFDEFEEAEMELRERLGENDGSDDYD